ncbi:MAG: NotI family restriction endonuclease [Kiritimatiellia bacterium]
MAKAPFKSQKCIFRSDGRFCNKRGGVCSLRPYSKTGETVVAIADSSLVATCPDRFSCSGAVVSWVGQVLLDTKEPVVITELPFLKSSSGKKSQVATVGKIDMVLIHPDNKRLHWCALEVQAVYFSGPGMATEFEVLKTWQGPGVPFSKKIRRPDFRSSGPKRLMPQLQIKVPTIARWGKKMAVVVDLPFWQSIGPIVEETDKSNCDIAWFVMKYTHNGKRFCLKPAGVHFTTLDRAIEGLTGGKPTTQAEFESLLRAKLSSR